MPPPLPSSSASAAEPFFAPWRAQTFARLGGLAAAGFVYVNLVLCGRTPWASPTEFWREFIRMCAGLILLHPLLNGWIARPLARTDRDLRWGLLSFVLALHWQWIPRYTGVDFSLNASLLRGRMAGPVLIALLAIAVALAVLVSHHFLESRRRGQGRAYLGLLLALAGIPLLITLAVSRTRTLHLHHYMLGALLMPLARYSTRASGAAFGLAFGLYVEGIARWGADPCWLPRV